MNGGMHDWRTFSVQLSTFFVGDMGLIRNYFLQERFEGKPLNLKENWRNNGQITFMNNKTEFENVDGFSIPAGWLKKFWRIKNLDKIYIYTDYAPRDEGSWKYSQDNQPEVVVDYRLIPNDGYQHTFRDRRIILKGYSVCDDFYSPDYSQKTLPDVKDYRRTLLWMPNVRFNQSGQAVVRLYNNSKPSVLSIEAEGITSKGSAVVYKAE